MTESTKGINGMRMGEKGDIGMHIIYKKREREGERRREGGREGGRRSRKRAHILTY